MLKPGLVFVKLDSQRDASSRKVFGDPGSDRKKTSSEWSRSFFWDRPQLRVVENCWEIANQQIVMGVDAPYAIFFLRFLGNWWLASWCLSLSILGIGVKYQRRWFQDLPRTGWATSPPIHREGGKLPWENLASIGCFIGTPLGNRPSNNINDSTAGIYM